MTARAVLFLDIDGVLHSASGHQNRLSRLPLLEAWLRQRPSVDVVIASTWRLRRSLSDLATLFSPDLRPRIVGTTPIISPDLWEAAPMYLRQAEVTAWLREHAHAGGTWDRWASLDDQHWLYPPFTKRLVAIVDPTVGVTEDELAKLDDILKRAWP